MFCSKSFISKSIVTCFLIHLFVLLFSFCYLIGLFLILISMFICFYISNNINISTINILQRSHSSINSHSNSSIDSNNRYSVSRFHMINQIFISTHMSGLRCLSFRHSFRCFLHLNMLLVTKHTKVMNHFKGHPSITCLTNIRFSNLSSFNVSVFFSFTFCAFEAGFFHFWDCIRGSYYDTF